MTALTLQISGMTCGHCVSAVKKALTAVEGVSVQDVTIGSARVEFDEQQVTREGITAAVEDEGYAVVSAT